MRRRWMVSAAIHLPGVDLIPHFEEERRCWTRTGAERLARRWSNRGRRVGIDRFGPFVTHGYGWCHESELAQVNRGIVEWANGQGGQPLDEPGGSA